MNTTYIVEEKNLQILIQQLKNDIENEENNIIKLQEIIEEKKSVNNLTVDLKAQIQSLNKKIKQEKEKNIRLETKKSYLDQNLKSIILKKEISQHNCSNSFEELEKENEELEKENNELLEIYHYEKQIAQDLSKKYIDQSVKE